MDMICVKCRVKMRLEQSLFPCVSMAGQCWSDVYSSDLLECPCCGSQVAALSKKPLIQKDEKFYVDDARRVTGKIGNYAEFWWTLKELADANTRTHNPVMQQVIEDASRNPDNAGQCFCGKPQPCQYHQVNEEAFAAHTARLLKLTEEACDAGNRKIVPDDLEFHGREISDDREGAGLLAAVLTGLALVQRELTRQQVGDRQLLGAV